VRIMTVQRAIIISRIIIRFPRGGLAVE